jgi:predicted GTPase
MLPELDLVLWVIKADDRALTVDEQFWHGVMQPYRQKVLFVINQADKIEPCHEWDTLTSKPSPHQLEILKQSRLRLWRCLNRIIRSVWCPPALDGALRRWWQP